MNEVNMNKGLEKDIKPPSGKLPSLSTPPSSPTPSTPMPAWLDDLIYVDEMVSKHVRVLAYGPMGVGKTRFLGTFPNIFILDFDRGLRTLKHEHKNGLVFNRHKPGNFRKIVEIIHMATYKLGPFAEGERLGQIESIGLDGYTDLADFLLYELMMFGGNPRNPNDTKPTWEDYAALQSRLKTITNMLKSIPMHVCATCMSKLDKDEVTGGYVGLPDITGGYKNQVGKDYDEVYYFNTQAGALDSGGQPTMVYLAYTKSHGYFSSKSRDDLPPVIKNPTFSTLYKV